ncbi:hypothetical protein [Actinomycetospora flava]|uniref:DUF485 domain-containing protein n=1 Tax=Actinomycetospora flava TaxID=3129232 RepID=A0ABU8M561_9PSEU
MSTEGGPAVTSRMARLFDVRYVIGGLLGFYGVVLVIRGLLDGAEQLVQAAGFAVNLWTGIVLVVVAITFLAWASLRPLGIEVDEEAEEMGAPPA